MLSRRLVPLLIFALPLAACGNKGPLVKPPTPVEQPTPAPAPTSPSPQPTGH